ncbi:7-deoxyloganetic acid glucosyl transferase-like isoform X1 [Actinidia eriantha]|uniref:7-deoxyloganetic acid glucosyl transferase-like isoform X1 n=1 Tax=Actinidia eriantha TaxID=165200 RepID=UPI00258A16ED|nr:7-deoxyloganetic acid glucosyl transferase-like isoform X1 [Actinidia eriantha]
MDRLRLDLPPHILIFPFPASSHVGSMLKLAELLCHGGLHVTFLVTHYIHGRLLRHSDVQLRFFRYSGFRLQTISDGLPEGDPRSGDKIMDLFHSFGATAKPHFRELLISNRQQNCDTQNPINCILADLLLSFPIDVAEELEIPFIYFKAPSTCNLWVYFCVHKLVEAGELPFKGTDLDAPIASVPGMERFLRRCDLPSFFRAQDVADRDFQMILNETLQIPRAKALILNTFEDLEGPILAHARSVCPKIYTIGPLHTHLKNRLQSPISSNSLWEEDSNCMAWLDTQPSRSVIYVSFGSIAMVSRDQLMEFWHGLVNSGKRFLWVVRPGSVAGEGESQTPTELVEGTRERGYMVGWAPQEEVLAHEAVGGFLTHSGWNSTLESIVAAVPMICWPWFGDQQINSRFVEEVWKLGLDMKDTCDRVIIEKMVRDLMDDRGEEFRQSADRMAELAKKAVREGGSSYCNLDCLIEDIRLLSADGAHVLIGRE